MALDHYVSQVHLRNFYSPDLKGAQMHALRKSDMKAFPCTSESVCRTEEGNTVKYLTNDRAIEDFLLKVEPRYNASVAKLREHKPDIEAIYALAGFTGSVGCCTPAAVRIHSEPLKSHLRTTAEMIDRQGLVPRAPASLGGKTLTELCSSGEVKFDVDPKFPQALGIDGIVRRTSLFGNSHWQVLHNKSESSPFFTSDYPLALERDRDGDLPNWLVPLTPALAIRITPDIRLSRSAPDLSFGNFTLSAKELTLHEIADINRLLVRSAEELVFFCDNRPWVVPFVEKNRSFHVRAISKRVPTPKGYLTITTQKIVPKDVP